MNTGKSPSAVFPVAAVQQQKPLRGIVCCTLQEQKLLGGIACCTLQEQKPLGSIACCTLQGQKPLGSAARCNREAVYQPVLTLKLRIKTHRQHKLYRR